MKAQEVRRLQNYSEGLIKSRQIMTNKIMDAAAKGHTNLDVKVEYDLYKEVVDRLKYIGYEVKDNTKEMVPYYVINIDWSSPKRRPWFRRPTFYDVNYECSAKKIKELNKHRRKELDFSYIYDHIAYESTMGRRGCLHHACNLVLDETIQDLRDKGYTVYEASLLSYMFGARGKMVRDQITKPDANKIDQRSLDRYKGWLNTTTLVIDW